jgi:hypothetical protein
MNVPHRPGARGAPVSNQDRPDGTDESTSRRKEGDARGVQPGKLRRHARQMGRTYESARPAAILSPAGRASPISGDASVNNRSVSGESPDFLDIVYRTSAASMAGLLRTSDATADHIIRLLRANGSLPTDRSESPEEFDRVFDAALHRLGELLTRFIEIALRFAVEDDDDYLRDLRTFYLRPRENYSIEELAAIWRTSCEQVRDVFHDEIDRWADAHPDAADAPLISWREAADANDAFAIARAFDVERALGDHFSRVRAPGWRTVPLLLHLPRFIIDAISSEAGTPSDRTLAACVERFVLDSFMTDGIRGAAGSRFHRSTTGS